MYYNDWTQNISHCLACFTSNYIEPDLTASKLKIQLKQRERKIQISVWNAADYSVRIKCEVNPMLPAHSVSESLDPSLGIRVVTKQTHANTTPWSIVLSHQCDSGGRLHPTGSAWPFIFFSNSIICAKSLWRTPNELVTAQSCEFTAKQTETNVWENRGDSEPRSLF